MLFRFYNHPQPLWVWADKTSISPIKLNLHVDVRERGKVSIKGGGSNQKRGGHGVSSLGPLKPSVKGIIRTLSSSDEVQGPEPPMPCRGESLLGYIQFTSVRSSWTPWLTTVRLPRPSLLAHSLQIHCIGPTGLRSHPPCGIGLKNETLQVLIYLFYRSNSINTSFFFIICYDVFSQIKR